MKDKELKLLQSLSEAYGPSGFEDEVLDVIEMHREKMSFERDVLKNGYLNRAESEDRGGIMLDAHSDEVGFIVRYIEDNGMIAFLPLGGWIASDLPSQLVMVRGKDGYHKGLINSKPIHFVDPKDLERPLDIENLRIDLGVSSKEEVLALGIRAGSPVVPYSEFSYRERDGVLMGKAFDNRMGCTAVVSVLQKLRELGMSKGVIGAIASQEEVGGRGAVVTSRIVKPRLALVFEGAPADDSFLPAHMQQCRLGGGPMIRHFDGSYIANELLIQIAEQVADEEGIPVQFAVRKGSGTNAGKIHTQHKGIPCLVLSVPCRYIHSHHQYAVLSDLKHTIDLAVAIVLRLQRDSILSEFDTLEFFD